MILPLTGAALKRQKTLNFQSPAETKEQLARY